MYISSIELSNFRSFKNRKVDFQEGLNVLIGHNNSGKTNLLQALSIIFDSKTSKQLSVDDFYIYIDLKELKNNPPKITITATFSQSNEEELGDELATVRTCRIELKKAYKAQIQYKFFVAETELNDYEERLKSSKWLSEAWSVIGADFIRKYIYKGDGGNPDNKATV